MSARPGETSGGGSHAAGQGFAAGLCGYPPSPWLVYGL